MERSLVTTEDGSHTVYLPELDEHYHSTHGAINESKHVFIQAGLEYVNADAPAVLEVGFGTGLNALLTLQNSIAKKQKTRYVALEPYPLEAHIFEQLNFNDSVKFEGAGRYFQKMHTAQWNFPVFITDDFVLHKLQHTLQETSFKEAAFDVVYFDAFAPAKQPEVWSTENFEKCFQALKPGGVLTTYSAQGQVRRNMQEAGFKTEKIPGPTGKREMLRAIKETS
ncbi:MAG: tRNA (5-methylaminomethyl-2-thiouridine)(34)-methyltransferase MnmD [Bacteroidota bacterium]